MLHRGLQARDVDRDRLESLSGSLLNVGSCGAGVGMTASFGGDVVASSTARRNRSACVANSGEPGVIVNNARRKFSGAVFSSSRRAR